jgi:hypothetical protein
VDDDNPKCVTVCLSGVRSKRCYGSFHPLFIEQMAVEGLKIVNKDD